MQWLDTDFTATCHLLYLGGGGLTAVTAQKDRNINATGHLLNICGGGSNCSGWTQTSLQLVIFCTWGGGPTAVTAQKHRNINVTGHLLNMGGFNCSLSFNCAYNYITAVLIKCICIYIPSQDKPFFRDNP